MKKPRVNATSIPWLMRIWESVSAQDSSYAKNDDMLRQAPSDVLDGWAMPHEVADLVRRRILCVMPVGKRDQTSLSTVTWDFTDRGIAIIHSWLENRPANFEEVYPANCCPNCGAELSGGN